MENQTRIGLGGTALFTVAGLASPILSWWIAGPIMFICVGVAGWGFWPVITEAAKRLSSSNAHAADKLIPMHKAIERVAERIGDLDASGFWPDARRAIRQAALDGRIIIYGHRSEDTGNTNATSWSLVSTRIPSEYWELADITVMASAPSCADEFTLHAMPHQLSDGRFTKQKIPYYAKTSTYWNAILQVWP